jgi:hypothetical protein
MRTFDVQSIELDAPPADAFRVATAHSRVTPHRGKSIYTFVLEAPPAPLEELEGALAEQSRILADELSSLAARMAKRVQGQLA